MQAQPFSTDASEKLTPYLPPPLKWAGGKRWLLPHLQPLLSNLADNRLVEPFTGGMAVSLGLRPRAALLNDVNIHLINFYRWVQRGLTITIPLSYNKELYYHYRERFNELIQLNKTDTKEAASLFYYLNRTGFNGLCRFNSKGKFNVPFGRYKTINYIRDFTPYIEVLQDWTINQGDFCDLQLRDGDVIYADPPYDVVFTTYSPDGFMWNDQLRLASWLANHQGPVITSNQATPRVLELYDGLGFTIQVLDAPRLIACNGNRTPAREILATKGV